MSAPNQGPGIRRHDDIYAGLIALHEGKSDEESLKLWARLALLLIEKIGEDAAVLAAIAEAKGEKTRTF